MGAYGHCVYRWHAQPPQSDQIGTIMQRTIDHGSRGDCFWSVRSVADRAN
jgi:hypothetical protein